MGNCGCEKDFWIQIKLPEPIIIYQISLKGKSSNTDHITSFILNGSHDGNIWVNLTTMSRKIGSLIEFIQFPNPLHTPYVYYRIHVIEAAGANPGLSHWQLYSLDPFV